MARPFRHEAPSMGEVHLRPRAAAALAARGRARLVCVVAGAGFGKTTALALAVADGSPSVDDRWLTCEPGDEAADHLLTGLVGASGLTSGSTLDDLCEEVWSRAPTDVCFVLDDVHEVAPRSEGAELLARLLADLPRNGHVVMASRDRVPVPTARLAAAAGLVRVTEADLVLDADALEAIAVRRGLPPGTLAGTGGWPALVELVTSAGSDLVDDYLWEEVLGGLDPERIEVLAGLSLVGGGDDAVASALADRSIRVDDVVAGVPLVARSSSGWATPHPLWAPVLRRHVVDAAAVRGAAAAAHLAAGRTDLALDLFIEDEQWDAARQVVRRTCLDPGTRLGDTVLARWLRAVPFEEAASPEGALAAGLAAQTSSLPDARAALERAAEGFRRRGDVEGELAAIARDGIVRWWLGDHIGLLGLHGRVRELAGGGSPTAEALDAIGLAALAHLGGQADEVLAHLAEVDASLVPSWAFAIGWLRSVAHRVAGDLARAHRAVDEAERAALGEVESVQARVARLRIDWLAGEVDAVIAGLARERESTAATTHWVLASELVFELASKHVWVGDLDAGRELLEVAEPGPDDVAGPRILGAVTRAGVALAAGDEAGAAAALASEQESLVTGPAGWYWRDRLVLPAPFVLLPETRERCRQLAVAPPHRAGIDLAGALVAARDGDLEPVRTLDWPAPGLVRANLPVPWIAELVAWADLAGAPTPPAVVEAVGPALADGLAVVAGSGREPVATAARARQAREPALPAAPVRVEVLGPLVLRRAGEEVSDPHLRRRRVRQLLGHMVVHRRVRREALAEDLWPDHDDPGRNLRVTLAYLQKVLQPGRASSEAPFYLRTDRAEIVLADVPTLTVDAWELDGLLDRADRAERAGDPGAAVAAYRAALPLWRGEPHLDAPDRPWALAERARLVSRAHRAAVRLADLLLAVGDGAGARAAAERAVLIDATAEPGHVALVRALVAVGDLPAARRAVARAEATLADLGVPPGPPLADLAARVAAGDVTSDARDPVGAGPRPRRSSP